MTVRRLMGSETEYGVIAPASPQANPTVLSAAVINTYTRIVQRTLQKKTHSDWEYGSESPLQDSRGKLVDADRAHPSQLTHRFAVLTSEEIAAEALQEAGLYAERLDWDSVSMNSILPNGARFYVDHAHPEYASPESMYPQEALLWDLAGDYICAQTVAEIAEHASEQGLPVINLYKNNTDSKGQSYGAHENYLLSRETNFDDVIAGLLPFFATRHIMIGAGRVGIGRNGQYAGFQISQRADFFERTVGLETTLRRPMVNTRDEPHADNSKYRRLHVISGDANMSQYSNLLKFGTAALVLELIEKGACPRILLKDPVEAMHTVSHDLSLSARLPLTNGQSMTALEIQESYLKAAWDLEAQADQQTHEVLSLWQQTLQGLRTDLFSLADRLDWVAKYQLLGHYLNQGLDWKDPKLAAIDLQYADIRPQKGLYFKLVERGRMQTIFSQQEIQAASWKPPTDTRAFLRGMMVRQWPEELVSVNWDTIVTRDLATGHLCRFLMPEPDQFTRDQVKKFLSYAKASDVLAELKESS